MRPRLDESELELESKTKSQFEIHRANLVSYFKELTPDKIPSELGSLNFVAYSRWKGFPVTCFAMDEEGINEIMPQLGKPWKCSVLSDFKADILDEDFVEEHDIPYEVMAIFLVEFLGDCWQEAHGNEYPIPVFGNHHDRSKKLNMVTNSWS